MPIPVFTPCNISGYFVTPFGTAMKGMKIRVVSMDNPMVTDYAAPGQPSVGVIAQSLDVATDADGFVQFNALQDSYLKIMFGDRAEQVRIIFVPMTATAELMDLAFPRVASVDVSLLTPAGIAVGAESAITGTATLSDTRTLPVTAFTTFASSAPGVATVASSTATGVSAGTSTITATAFDYAAFLDGVSGDLTDVHTNTRPASEAFRDARDTLFIRKPDPNPAVTFGVGAVLTVT